MLPKRSMREIQDQADQAIELSIVMPCLNEAETLETCIQKAKRFLESHRISGEIVVGDNGSSDGSQQIAERCGARVVDVPVRGYGAALYHATLAARGKYVIMGDSDDSYDFSNLMPFVEKLRENYDLVMGNRFAGGIQDGAMPWKNRYIGNPALSGIGRVFYKIPVRDFHCGLRGYSKAAFKKMDLHTTGMEFASEMVIKASLSGLRITEVPTTLKPDGRSRPPHLRPWRDGWRHLRFMLLFSPRWLFYYPGLVLISAGLFLGSLLVTGPLDIGRLRLDIHTLYYSAIAVMIGFQSVSFFILSQISAVHKGLIPPSKRLQKFLEHFVIERGIGLGAILFIAGVVGLLIGVEKWGTSEFANIEPRNMMRIVIPSGLAVMLGLNIVMVSFFLGVLQLPTRREMK